MPAEHGQSGAELLDGATQVAPTLVPHVEEEEHAPPSFGAKPQMKGHTQSALGMATGLYDLSADAHVVVAVDRRLAAAADAQRARGERGG